jgi:AraC-like DNA-binding protein
MTTQLPAPTEFAHLPTHVLLEVLREVDAQARQSIALRRKLALAASEAGVSAKRMSTLTGAASKSAILYWIQQGRVDRDRAAGILDPSEDSDGSRPDDDA